MNAQLPSPKYQSHEEFMKDYEKGKRCAVELYDKALYEMRFQLLWGELREYNFKSLPFVATRIQTALESEFFVAMVTFKVAEEYCRSLDYYRWNLYYKDVPCPPREKSAAALISDWIKENGPIFPKNDD